MQRRNFRFLGLALAGALALGTAACGDDVVIPEAAPTITLTPSNFDLNVGETATVVASVTNLDGATFTFASSDASVASVTATGNTATIKALKSGSTTITVKGTANGKSVDAAVQVRVNAAPPAQKATLTLNPTQASVNVGQQFPLIAIVTNAANPALTWTSSAASVATVDANGVVTGVAAGTALITAKLNADTTVKAVAAITVNKIGGSAAIGISGIFVGDTQTPANPADIKANIALQMNVTPGSTDSLRVFVDNTLISSCSRNFAGTSNSNQVVTCVINTAALDASGNAIFPNGQHVINARLFGNGQVAATVSSEPLTFANVNAMALSITTKGVSTANGTAIGTDGLLWNEGDVVVTATPAVFTGNVGTVNAPQICLSRTGAADFSCATSTAVAGTSSFTATFPKSKDAGNTSTTRGVKAISDHAVVASVAGATTTGGFPFPGGVSAAIRLDNTTPSAGTLALPASVSNNFIGSNFAFNKTNLFGNGGVAPTDPGAANVPADGSGVAKIEFFVGANVKANQDATNAEFVAANPTAITNSDQLKSSVTNDAYILVARVTDATGNVSYTRLGHAFGVALEVPTIKFVSGIANSTVVEAGDELVVEAESMTAGFGATPFEYQIIRTTAENTRCINVNTNAATTVTADGGACKFNASASGTYELPADNGYYQINVRVRDRAGNVSADVVSRFVLVDDEAPEVAVSGFTFTNTTISLTGTLTDNVSLLAYDVRLGFGGGFTLPFVTRTVFGAFGLPVLASKTVTGTTPLVLSLQDRIGGAVVNVSSAGFGAYDVAGNFGFGSINIVSPVAGGAVSADIKTFQVTNTAGTNICAATPGKDPCGTSADPIPATRKLTATATGPTGSFNNPFARVLFYRVDMAGQTQLIGESGTPSFTDTGTGNGRTYTYSVTFNAAGLPHQMGAPIFAVGVEASGKAVITDAVPFNILADVID